MKNNRHIIVSDNCIGCFSCVNVCKNKAISIVEHKDTFLFPKVDLSKCIECGKCLKVCPLNYNNFSNFNDIDSYYGATVNIEEHFKSSSGGAFFELCKYFIKNKYIVYGCVFDKNFNVVHKRATTLKDCEKFRKSKYVQSNICSCYKKITSDLIKGNKIVFSGAPCQCAAVKLYLLSNNFLLDNIVFVDVLCHGVPSQKMFNEYIRDEEIAFGEKVTSFQFRNKNKINSKINTRTACIQYANNKNKIVSVTNSPFLYAYYFRVNYRKSCYMCNFARQDRVSDITLGDAWGIKDYDDKYNENEGVSLILFNTSKGKQFISAFKDLKLNEVSNSWVFNSQKLFYEPTPISSQRNKFLKYYSKFSFSKAVWKSMSLKTKIGRLLRKNALMARLIDSLRT